MYKSWLVTVAIVGATTSFAVHALSADKTESVFIDEGDGDFDAVPSATRAATNAPTPSQDTTTPSQKPVKAAKKTRGEKIAEVLKETPNAKPGPAPVVAPAPAPETQAEQVAAQPEAQPEPKAEPKAEHKAESKPAKKSASKSKGKTSKTASSKKDPGVFVTTREACPMTREPASESAKMITVKPSKKIWVEKVDGGKWYRAYNKAGEPGYIDGSCVTVQ